MAAGDGPRPAAGSGPGARYKGGVLPDHARVVILGAGLAGAATSFHLHRRGVHDVLLLERRAAPGLGASGRNAGILRVPEGLAPLTDLARRSVPHLVQLGVVQRTGGLVVGGGDDAPPAAHPLASLRGRRDDEAGTVDVVALLGRYLEGAHVLAGIEAEPPSRTAAGRWQVATSAGAITADVVVNATGSHAGRFGAGPLTPTRRHVAVTHPDPRARPDFPWVWDLTASWYARPWQGGWLLCVGDETPCGPDDEAVDDAVIAAIAERFEGLLAGVAPAGFARTWVGHRTFAPDRLPRIGADPAAPGLVHVAGLGGHGVTLSHAIGEQAAAAVLRALRTP